MGKVQDANRYWKPSETGCEGPAQLNSGGHSQAIRGSRARMTLSISFKYNAATDALVDSVLFLRYPKYIGSISPAVRNVLLDVHLRAVRSRLIAYLNAAPRNLMVI